MPGHYGKGMKKTGGTKKKGMNKGMNKGMSKLPASVRKKIMKK